MVKVEPGGNTGTGDSTIIGQGSVPETVWKGHSAQVGAVYIWWMWIFVINLTGGCRYGVYLDWVDGIDEQEGGFEKFTRAYDEYGIHAQADGSIKCREWAPGAEALFLTGDFSTYWYL